MTKMQFQAAARRVQEEIEDESSGDETAKPKYLEFTLAGQDFELDYPTTTQLILLSTSADDGTMRSMIRAALDFLEGLMHGDGFRRFKKLMAKGLISNDLLVGGDDANEQGIIDWIAGQVSDGRPTEPPADSSPSPASTGRRSTGRAPGKGSIRSASPSADSST